MERITVDIPEELFREIEAVSERRMWELNFTVRELLFWGLVTETLKLKGVRLVGRMPDGSLKEILEEKKDG
jgi:hypothetical protein